MKSRHRLIPLVGLLLAGCATRQASGPPVVAVTIHPLQTIVKALAGPAVEVATLLPPGMSPHAYDPVPSAVRVSSSAALVVAMDPDVDGWVSGMASGVPLWRLNESIGHADPHAWLDPAAVAAALPSLTAALCSVVPDSCDDIDERSLVFAAALDELQRRGRVALLGRRCVVSAPFLTAFSPRFGLDVLHVIAPVEGVEPSSGSVREAIVHARSSGLVVGQLGLPDRAAEIVAESSGARLVRVDPIGRPETAPTYDALISSIIAAIGGTP